MTNNSIEEILYKQLYFFQVLCETKLITAMNNLIKLAEGKKIGQTRMNKSIAYA
jgi:hypothetical protein